MRPRRLVVPFSKGGLGSDCSGRLPAGTKAPPALFRKQTRDQNLFLAMSPAASMSPAAAKAAAMETATTAESAAATKAAAAAKGMH